VSFLNMSFVDAGEWSRVEIPFAAAVL